MSQASLLSVLCVLGLASILGVGCAPVFAQERPNIVFIMADDQDFRSVARMPNVRSSLIQKGTTFTRAFASTSTCCPSRATFLTGQYPHNHGVKTNTGPEGGYEKAKELGIEESTVATWLDDAGYVTAYAGKYLNQYGTINDPNDPAARLRIPPGWDAWWVYTRGMNTPLGYYVNEKGKERWVDRSVLPDPDYLAWKAAAFVRNQNPNGRPWFLVVAPFTPHFPYFHAERHANLFSTVGAPRYPNFNEEDVSDKPWYIQRRPFYDEERVAEIDERFRDRMRGLRSVDEMVGKVMEAIKETGQLSDTYVVYTSDNGYLMGEHRWEGKSNPYEGSIRVPFIVRGPGVPPGVKRDQMVVNVDWAPSIARWAGVNPPTAVDGRSISPLFAKRPPAWRERVLLAYFGDYLPYWGLRTADNKLYVEYESGEREYYDLNEDPYQLDNAYPSMDATLKASLVSELEALKGCAGEACRAAEEDVN